MKILLGQLGANGDCLFATTIARQIKADYPDCHLTWAVGEAYRSVLDGNPYIDDVWELPIYNHQDLWDKWDAFVNKALEFKKNGYFDEIFLTQIPPNNFKNFDGTVRASIFNGYPNPITVPDSPIIRLFPEEVDRVRRFADYHHLAEYNNVILFEYSSGSDQSFVTVDLALEVASQLVKKISNLCIVMSSNVSLTFFHKRVIDGSTLSFRENAELTKYCTLLVGCSSGISWLCTSDWAKQLPMIQLLKKDKSVYASFTHDYEYRHVSTDNIIEMTDCGADKIVGCVDYIIKQGFAKAKPIYNEKIDVSFKFYAGVICKHLIFKGKYVDTITSIKLVINRYGIRIQLIYHLLSKLVKRCIISLFSLSPKNT